MAVLYLGVIFFLRKNIILKVQWHSCATSNRSKPGNLAAGFFCRRRFLCTHTVTCLPVHSVCVQGNKERAGKSHACIVAVPVNVHVANIVALYKLGFGLLEKTCTREGGDSPVCAARERRAFPAAGGRRPFCWARLPRCSVGGKRLELCAPVQPNCRQHGADGGCCRHCGCAALLRARLRLRCRDVQYARSIPIAVLFVWVLLPPGHNASLGALEFALHGVALRVQDPVHALLVRPARSPTLLKKYEINKTGLHFRTCWHYFEKQERCYNLVMIHCTCHDHWFPFGASVRPNLAAREPAWNPVLGSFVHTAGAASVVASFVVGGSAVVVASIV